MRQENLTALGPCFLSVVTAIVLFGASTLIDPTMDDSQGTPLFSSPTVAEISCIQAPKTFTATIPVSVTVALAKAQDGKELLFCRDAAKGQDMVPGMTTLA